MTSFLQQTRTGQPRVPATNLIHRAAPLALLEVAFRQRVTMVVAAAGYGKTVLLQQWAQLHGPKRVRWITVTADHDRPGRLLGAVQRTLSQASASGDVALVLDDVDRLTNDDVAADLAAVLATLPTRYHVVLAGRAEPSAMWYRLGSSEIQVELRDDALAFSDDEAIELLGERASIHSLRDADGWVTALVLAEDDERLARYFDEEVLVALDPSAFRFVLATSVLRDLTGPLCDAVTGSSGGAAALADLRAASLFVRRRPGSTRLHYHGLFRAHLRRRLHAEDPALERQLLLRAARWHLERDEFDPGMAYLLEAEAWDDAVDAAFAHSARLLALGQATSVARWLATVPSSVRSGRPAALLLEAAARLFGNEPGRAAGTLDAVDGLTDVAPDERVIADLLRGYVALHRGAVWQAVAASDRVQRATVLRGAFDGPNVFGLTGCRDDVVAAARVLRGVGLVYEGRLAEARASLDPAVLGCHAIWQVSALGASALLEAWSGRLGRAEQLAAQALATGEELGLRAPLVTTSAFLALAIVARERDDLGRADAFLAEAAERSGSGQSRMVVSAVVVEEALLAAAKGDAERGLRILGARRDLEHPSTPPAVVLQRAATKAHLLLLVGDVETAADAILGAPQASTSELRSLRVRVAVEGRDLDEARRVLRSWPDGTTPRERVERALWRAVVEHLDGDEDSARRDLAAAVAEAEPERDLGPFRRAGRHVLGPARALYRTMPTPFVRAVVEQPAPPAATRVSPRLVEQLTDREYLVLSLLPTRLSNSEIAEQLEVSLNTVKTHLKHIYRKLDVPGRREAVGSAEQLRLL